MGFTKRWLLLLKGLLKWPLNQQKNFLTSRINTHCKISKITLIGGDTCRQFLPRTSSKLRTLLWIQMRSKQQHNQWLGFTSCDYEARIDFTIVGQVGLGRAFQSRFVGIFGTRFI